MSSYAARVRAARAYAGFTQKELAERLGVDEQTIKRREAGKQDPNRAERLAISMICRVPVDFMEMGFGAAERDQILEAIKTLGEEVAALRATTPESPSDTTEEQQRDDNPQGADPVRFQGRRPA